MTKTKFSTRYVAVCGMFIAIAYVLTLVGQLVPNVAGFLSYDPKDVAVVIVGFIMGPMASVLVSVVTSLLEMVSVSSTGPIGFLMNVLSTCAFAVPAAILYRKMHSQKGAVLGLVAGIVCMAVCMILWNYIVTPLYMGVPREVVAGMLASVFLPFNLIKGALNAVLTMLLYKPVVGSLRAAKLIEAGPAKTEYKAANIIVLLVVFAVLIALFMKLAGVI